MACNITGQVVIPDGSSAANRQITLRKEDFTLSAQGSLSILPEEIVVYTDALGNVDFDLVAGTYSGYYVSSPDGRAPFRLRVPDGATTANFADLIVVTSVTYDPALTQLVLDAKEAIENGGSGGGGTNAVWGSITGTLSNQLDLNTALAGKASTSSLNLKANVTDVTNGLALKADTTYVDSALAGKANTSDLTLKANVTDVLAGLATKSDVGHTHTFASLTEKPTDISGYGITDGVTIHSTQTVTGKKHFSQPVVLVGTATDPASVEDGGLWYNSTERHIKTKINGNLVELDSPLASSVVGLAPVATSALLSDISGTDIPFVLPPSNEWVVTTMGAGGTLSAAASASDRLDLFPFSPRTTFTASAAAFNVNTAGPAASFGRIIIYDSDSNGRPNNLLFESGDLLCDTTGVKSTAINILFRRGRTFWLGVRSSSTTTFSSWPQTSTPDLNGGATPSTGARKMLRRTVSMASGAPTPWVWSSSDLVASSATAVWLRVA